MELLLLSRRDERTWEALTRGKGLHPGARLWFRAAGGPPAAGAEEQGLAAEVIAETESGARIVRFERPVEPLLHEMGKVPLPPYIHVPLADSERYQTVYGRVEGSVAALHRRAPLHPGAAGRPAPPRRRAGIRDPAHRPRHLPPGEGRADRGPPDPHRVGRGDGTGRAAGQPRPPGGAAGDRRRHDRGPLARVGRRGGEPAGEACPWRTVSAFSGPTGLYIYPGYRFRAVDAMITNFHLPRSTLLMLVSAFAGRDLIFRAYQRGDPRALSLLLVWGCDADPVRRYHARRESVTSRATAAAPNSP